MFKKIVFMLLLLLLVACGQNSADSIEVGELQIDSYTAELGDIDNARVEINMGVGELTVAGGATDLVNGEFTYNIAEWKPMFNSEDDNVIITQDSGDNIELGSFEDGEDFRNEWDIQLNNDVMLDLFVTAGLGESRLVLTGLTLSSADFDMGVGDATIDLSGDWSQDATIRVEAGVGRLTIIVPKDVGVTAEISKGMGDINASDLTQNGDTYTNTAYGTTDVTLTLDINANIGKITVKSK